MSTWRSRESTSIAHCPDLVFDYRVCAQVHARSYIFTLGYLLSSFPFLCSSLHLHFPLFTIPSHSHPNHSSQVSHLSASCPSYTTSNIYTQPLRRAHSHDSDKYMPQYWNFGQVCRFWDSIGRRRTCSCGCVLG
jgi:hypothetical protein